MTNSAHAQIYSLRSKLIREKKYSHKLYLVSVKSRQDAVFFKTRMVDAELTRLGQDHLTGQERRDARYAISARLGPVLAA